MSSKSPLNAKKSVEKLGSNAAEKSASLKSSPKKKKKKEKKQKDGKVESVLLTADGKELKNEEDLLANAKLDDVASVASSTIPAPIRKKLLDLARNPRKIPKAGEASSIVVEYDQASAFELDDEDEKTLNDEDDDHDNDDDDENVGNDNLVNDAKSEYAPYRNESVTKAAMTAMIKKTI